MSDTFAFCTLFNAPLPDTWATSSVDSMHSMFMFAEAYNQPLPSTWSFARDTGSMFENCFAFNQPLDHDTSRMETMRSMFRGCKSFDQPLVWKTAKVRDFVRAFSGCVALNRELRLDMRRVNYDAEMLDGCPARLVRSNLLLADGDRDVAAGEEECSICFARVRRYGPSTCIHRFCGECLDEFFGTPGLQQKCPLCRAPMSRADLIGAFGSRRQWPLEDLVRLLDEATGLGPVGGRALPPAREGSAADRARCSHLRRADAGAPGSERHVARAVAYARKAVCVRCGERAMRRL